MRRRLPSRCSEELLVEVLHLLELIHVRTWGDYEPGEPSSALCDFPISMVVALAALDVPERGERLLKRPERLKPLVVITESEARRVLEVFEEVWSFFHECWMEVVSVGMAR